jgi:hypothetical protein
MSMYWAGGCPGRVHRGNKPYPGAKRFMQPKMEPMPRDWHGIISNTIGSLLLFSLVGFLVYILLVL